MKNRSPRSRAEGELQVLLQFLKRTRDGLYVPIDGESLSYMRVGEESEPSDTFAVSDEEFHYGIS